MEAIIHPFALCNHSMPCGPLERKNNIKNLYNFHLGVHTISDVRTNVGAMWCTKRDTIKGWGIQITC